MNSLWLVAMATWKSSALGECTGPQMMLLSDDPRRTCTDISASKNRVEYSCASLIKSFPRAMIKYCPVELCQENGTWSKPSISCAMSECYFPGQSQKYIGHRTCTTSGRQCQRWDTQEPFRHKFRKDSMFPDEKIDMAEAFCRDPDGVKGAPWCFTTDPKKKWEFCDIRECPEMVVSDGDCDVTEDPLDYAEYSESHCSNSLQYQMYNNYRINNAVAMVTIERSAIECASSCSHVNTCRAFTYHVTENTCQLHNGNTDMLIKSRDFRTGVKTCAP